MLTAEMSTQIISSFILVMVRYNLLIMRYMSSDSQWNDDIQDHQLILVYDSRLPLYTTSIWTNFHNLLSCIRVHPIVYSRRTEWKQFFSFSIKSKESCK
uniref:Uncharacterized protein n=1 Tax=Trichogramma kaykai TaxID=54128 RepID=A0ABD2XHM6_9HYME